MSKSISLGVIQPEEPFRTERRDAAENRVRILEVARSLFDEYGVAEVNMADIALAAKVGKGTLYRRFANKGELCYALMDEHLAGFQDEMLTQMQQMTQAGVLKLEQLSAFLNALVLFTEEHVPLLCEVQRIRLLEGAQNLQLPHFWQYMTIQGLLQAADEAGEISPDVDITLLADMLLAPLSADFYRFLRLIKGYSPEQIGAGLQNIVQGLRS
ncbi:MAG: TetR/AcrR family transcriptional regulator [Candidatus Promineifilaceae bacterium]